MDPNGAALTALLGLGIPFFLYWLCCGVVFWYVQRYLQGGDEDSGKALKVKEEVDLIPSGSFKNYWPVITIVTDFLQLSAFCLDPDVIPWPNGIKPFFGALFSFFLFNLHSVGAAEYAVFWIVFTYTVFYAVVLLLLLIGAMCEIRWINQIKDDIIDMKEGWLKTIGEFMLFEMPPILYLPIAWSMLEWLSCDYKHDPPHLDMDNSIICWQDIHILYATFSLLALFLFFPITLLVSAGRVALESDVRIRPSFMILVAMLKFLVVTIAQNFTGYHIFFSIAVMFLNGAMLAANIKMLPCTVRVINHWRTGGLIGSLWTSICAFIALISSFETKDTTGGIVACVLLMVGWAAIASAFAYLHFKRFKWGRVRDVGNADLTIPMVASDQSDDSPTPSPLLSSPSPPVTSKPVNKLPTPKSANGGRTKSGRSRADARMAYMDWETPYT